jgi:uncharacterized iron-regulated membrane protein
MQLNVALTNPRKKYNNTPMIKKDSLINFCRRMHAIIGLMAGPFIIIATLTGALYGISYATENWFYKDALFVKNQGTHHSLAQQIEAANSVVKNEGELFALRPSTDAHETSRVLYTAKNLNESEYRTLFVDPNTLEIKGDMVTYGSGGALPFRTKIDLLHRDLLLGQWGRWYSELAASWLWIMGLSGLLLFIKRFQAKRLQSKNHYQQLVNYHSYLGVLCFMGLLMFSITGLTWSGWAGDNIAKIRSTFNWITPSVQRELPLIKNTAYDLSMFDKVEEAARQNGIDAKRIEIRPGKKSQEAWLISEIERTLPTNVDAVGIDPISLKAVSRIKFQDFSIMAKLTRWGIDLHMGSLFGLLNQILLVIISVAIAMLIISGYLMWFKRKGWRIALHSNRSLWREFTYQPKGNKILIATVVLIIGIILPVFLVSLFVFVSIEELIYIVMFYQIERT